MKDQKPDYLPPEEIYPSQAPVFKSQELFGPHTTIIIKHREQTYRLMITKQDKLILNK